MKMIILEKVKINKYKSIETEQGFDVDEKITTLVGKNESGKTAILEAIAKSNYFDSDPKFEFDATYDYPRKEKKQFDKSGEEITVITCYYQISRKLLEKIGSEVGSNTFSSGEKFTYSKKYRSTSGHFGLIVTDNQAFFKFKLQNHKIFDKEFKAKVNEINSLDDINTLISEINALESKDEKQIAFLQDIKVFL